LLIWAEGIVGIFNAEPELVRIASAFLRISVAAYLVLAFTTILQQCISGAGDTLPPMVISLPSIWLIQVPLAVFLPRVGGLDVYGVRWAMVASAILGMVAYTIYFRAGRWKRKKV
jgi:Na+-driven multidrug efflux pump